MKKRWGWTRWVYWEESNRKMWCILNGEVTRVWAHGVALPGELEAVGWIACSAPHLRHSVDGGVVFEGVIEKWGSETLSMASARGKRIARAIQKI